MKRLSSLLLLLTLFVAGCGGGDVGPASPDATPKVSEEEVKQKITQGMPENAKKMYDQYQKGNTPR
jgi:hypothetical protein